MAEWRWHYAVDTCGAKDDRPLETEIDVRKRSNPPLESGKYGRTAPMIALKYLVNEMNSHFRRPRAIQ